MNQPTNPNRYTGYGLNDPTLSGHNGGPTYDPDRYEAGQAFQLGGNYGVANQQAGALQARAGQWGNLQAPPIDYSGSNQYMGLGDQARMSQSGALSLEQQAALGATPSQAAILMRQGNDQAMAAQMGLAAGARGPAAMAIAQQQAAGNAANMQTQNINNTGALRAQEMANARNAYMQGASGMRSQDLSAAQQMAQQAQAQGQLGLGYKQLGLQGELGFNQQALGTQEAQLQASQNFYNAQQQHWQAQMGADAASQQAANANAWKIAGIGADAGSSLIGMAGLSGGLGNAAMGSGGGI